MEQIKSALDVISRRRIVVIVTMLAGFLAVLFLLRYVPRTYQASSHVLIVSENDGRDPSVASADLPSVATSTVVLSRVIQRLHLSLPVIDLESKVKAKVAQRSSIMEISYRDVSADRAVSVPNAVADELSSYYGQISTERADQDLGKLDVAINQTRKRLFDINDRLARLTSANLALGSDHSYESLTEHLDDLQAQRQIASASLEGDVAGARAVSPSDGAVSKIADNEILSNDAYYRSLVAGTAKDESELTFDEAQYTNRLPGLQELKDKVASENELIAQERKRLLQDPTAFSASQAEATIASRKADAVVSGDRSKVEALDRLISDTNSRLSALPDASARYAWLRLQRDSAQADYLALSARRTSAVASRAEALSLGSVVVIDRAVRATAAVVGLSRSRLAIVTAFLVLAIGLGMAFVAEYVDPRLRRPDQIENLYGTELLVTFGKQ